MAKRGSGALDARSPPLLAGRADATKDPRPGRLPSDCRLRARRLCPQGCITWSQRVKRSCQPQVHGWVPLAGFTMGDRQRPGENQPNTRRENAQLRPGSVRKSLSCPCQSLKRMHEPDPYGSGSFGAAGSLRRAHIQARPSQAGRGGRERARPALARCLQAAPATRGAGGDPKNVPGGPAGGRAG